MESSYFEFIPKELLYTIINFLRSKKDFDLFINSIDYINKLFSIDSTWKELLLSSKCRIDTKNIEKNTRQNMK